MARLHNGQSSPRSTSQPSGAARSRCRPTSRVLTAGGQLLLVGRRERPITESAALVTEHGGGAHVLTADLVATGGPACVVAAAVNTLGGVDLLVNNAGDVRAGRLVAAEIVTALAAGEALINTSSPDRRRMQELNVTDPWAVDAALTPKLATLEAATRAHRSI